MRVSYRDVQKVSHAGYSFASKLEAALFDYLKILEIAGDIVDIQVQPHVRLSDAGIVMIPDFKVFNLKEKASEYYEAKGHETPVYRIKRKLWTVYGPGKLLVFKGSAKRLVLFETITPKK